MNIAVDAMGGDHAPAEIVKGAELAVAELGCEVTLVGDESQVLPYVKDSPHLGKRLHLVHASEAIPMDASPTDALRKYKEASITVALGLVARGEASAVVSAGNTGVAMMAALKVLGRVPGIERPAIGSVLPTLTGSTLLIDVGANVDCRPSHLHQFGLMGAAYAQRILGIRRPRVALLSNGEEEGKGNDLVVQAYQRLRAEPAIHFIGNIEGRDIMAGGADVVVCDGFIGNVILKFAEGMARALFDILKQGIQSDFRSKMGGLLLKPTLRKIWRQMDYTEYGGAPLLGVDGVCIIGHGSSNAKAIKNGIRVAREAVEANLPAVIGSLVQAQPKEEDGRA